MQHRTLAALGGSYGNTAALRACLDHAATRGADLRAFLGDGIGCCGHSEEVLALIREGFDVLVAGNHEQQAASRAESCGCGYASPEDEAVSCEAFRLATESLTESSRAWLGTWPDHRIVEMEGGRVLLCHGSPGATNEFLYEVELDDLRLSAWLDTFDVRGFVCTHSGLPWIRRLRGGRFAVNCGAVGKPDHDGDPAVHYARIFLPRTGEPELSIERVEYDHEAFAAQMERAGIGRAFTDPVRTGVWTIGVASLPAAERGRPLRDHRHAPRAGAPSQNAEWRPRHLRAESFRRVLDAFRDLRLLTLAESEEVLRLLDPAFPFFAATRLAESIHLHVKVDDVRTLPHDRILALGTHAENARQGYVKYPFEGGVNLIFSDIDVAEEDLLPPQWERRARPFLDHAGVDMREESGLSRASFDEVASTAQRIGWAHVPQGGRGQPVFCCHVAISAKHWVYPPQEGSPFTRPVEFAYGPLEVRGEASGCDLRPIDPRHPAAPEVQACVAAHAEKTLHKDAALV